MKIISSLLLSFGLLAAFAVAGDAVNTTCPFSGKDVDASQTVTIDKAVSFCCGKCLGKFNDNPAALNAKVLKAESQAVNEACPYTGKDVSKTVMVKGQAVGVCCGKCAKKIGSDTGLEVKATNPATALCPVSGKPAKADKTATAKVKVAFCCEKCVEKATKNPGAVLGKL